MLHPKTFGDVDQANRFAGGIHASERSRARAVCQDSLYVKNLLTLADESNMTGCECTHDDHQVEHFANFDALVCMTPTCWCAKPLNGQPTDRV